MITSTYTYSIMEVSDRTYDEIYKIMKEAGYDQNIEDDGGIIDLHGLALSKKSTNKKEK